MNQKDLTKYLLGALAGGVTGGGLSGYLSSQNKIKGESKKDRRKRILRNALIGTGLGGVAGGGITAGADLMSKGMSAPMGDAKDNITSDYNPGGGAMSQLMNRINPFDRDQDSAATELTSMGFGALGGMLSNARPDAKAFIENLRTGRSNAIESAVSRVKGIGGNSTVEKLNQLVNKVTPTRLKAFQEGLLGKGRGGSFLDKFKTYNALLGSNSIQNAGKLQSSGINPQNIRNALGMSKTRKGLYDFMRLFNQGVGGSPIGKGFGSLGKLKTNVLGTLGGYALPKVFTRGMDVAKAFDNPNSSDFGKARNYAIIDRLNELAQRSSGGGRALNWQDLQGARDSLDDGTRSLYNIDDSLLQSMTTDSAKPEREGLQYLIDALKGGDNPTVPQFSTP
jgi:hypothetical protein